MGQNSWWYDAFDPSERPMREAAHEHLDYSIPRLFGLHDLQAREIAHLRTLVGVLIRMLIDSKTVDEQVLRYRLQAELEEAAGAAPASTGDPYRGGPAQEVPAFACVACGKNLVPAEAAPTSRGPMCNSCFTTGA